MYPGRSLKKSAFFPAVGAAQPSGRYALTGPAHVLDAARWPVRGDLAHMALAGRCFVPHYVVPMAYVLVAPAPLRAAPRDSGDVRAMLAVGARFDVMDIVGGWAWGLEAQADGALGGLVGYVPVAALAPAPAGDDSAEAA